MLPNHKNGTPSIDKMSIAYILNNSKPLSSGDCRNFQRLCHLIDEQLKALQSKHEKLQQQYDNLLVLINQRHYQQKTDKQGNYEYGMYKHFCRNVVADDETMQKVCQLKNQLMIYYYKTLPPYRNKLNELLNKRHDQNSLPYSMQYLGKLSTRLSAIAIVFDNRLKDLDKGIAKLKIQQPKKGRKQHIKSEVVAKRPRKYIFHDVLAISGQKPVIVERLARP